MCNPPPPRKKGGGGEKEEKKNYFLSHCNNYVHETMLPEKDECMNLLGNSELNNRNSLKIRKYN